MPSAAAVHHQQARGRSAGRRAWTSPSRAPPGSRRPRRRSGRCRGGSRRARPSGRGSAGSARPRRRASSSMPARSRLREASSCLAHRRSWRSRKPSGRPKSREAHLGGVHGVQPDQGVDQVQRGGAGARGPRGELLGRRWDGCPPRTPSRRRAPPSTSSSSHRSTGRGTGTSGRVQASSMTRCLRPRCRARLGRGRGAAGVVRTQRSVPSETGVGEVRPSALDQP